jgi:hypothetical protein
MLKNVVSAMTTATRRLIGNWRALITFVGLYVALLLVLYLFFTTREASIGQLLLTLLTAIAAPVLFFVLQTLGISYTAREASLGVLLKQSLRQWWRLILISLPLLLLAWLIAYLLGQLELQVPAAMREAARTTVGTSRPPSRDTTLPIQWLGVVVTALRFLLLYLALPLATIHLWIVTAREGLGAAIRGVGRSLARAFAPRAVLIYACGLVVFGVIPYFLIFTKTPVSRWWLEVTLLGARLALALLFILFGWVITLGALASPATEGLESRKNEAGSA